jgi:hypothetical protein
VYMLLLLLSMNWIRKEFFSPSLNHKSFRRLAAKNIYISLSMLLLNLFIQSPLTHSKHPIFFKLLLISSHTYWFSLILPLPNTWIFP